MDVRKAYELFQQTADLGHVWAERQLAAATMKGLFGIWRIPFGLIRFVRVLMVACRLNWNDRHSDKLLA